MYLPYGRGFIDLRPLSVPSYYRADGYNGNTTMYNIYLSICGTAVDFPNADICNYQSGKAGYMIDYRNFGRCYPLSPPGSITMSLLDASNPDLGVILDYGEQRDAYDSSYRATKVYVYCSTNSSFTLSEEQINTPSLGHTTLIFTMYSPEACVKPYPTTTTRPTENQPNCVLPTYLGTYDLRSLSAYSYFENDVGSWRYYMSICGTVSNFPDFVACGQSGFTYAGYQVSIPYTPGINNCYPITTDVKADHTLQLIDPSRPDAGVILKYSPLTLNGYSRASMIYIQCSSNTTFSFIQEQTLSSKSSMNVFSKYTPVACIYTPPPPTIPATTTTKGPTPTTPAPPVTTTKQPFIFTTPAPPAPAPTVTPTPMLVLSAASSVSLLLYLYAIILTLM